MQTNNSANPYIDEVAANSEATGYAAKFKKASLDPRIDALEDTKAASITDNSDTEFEHDLEDLVEGDGEFEFEKDTKTDDFSAYDPYKDRHGGKNKDQQQEQRQQRRLGKVKRKEAPEPTREEVFAFLEGMDKILDAADDASTEDDVDKEFENWNNWFKAEKKAPPAPDSSKVFYIREEYNTKRSPHLWKSNPNKKWVLAFGANEVNNHVAANLYKYQNDTISKDA